ncbi:MAG: DNA-binding protein [Bacilli bacterium]|nr:DNA-binding protein [Bacilli bacterium]
MDKTVYLINLFDYYGDLLTEKQKEYFKEYYFNNLSLSEISDNSKVSRNGVHKALKEAEGKLNYYENVLSEYKRSVKIKNLIKDLDDDIKKKIEELI